MAKGYRYSFANYILVINVPAEIAEELGASVVTFGGKASYLGKIEIEYNKEMWSTKGDASGGFIHEQNLDETGNITISINQLSEKVNTLKTLFNIYKQVQSNVDELNITLTDMNNKVLHICESCLITKIPNQSFASETEEQEWVFTSGRISTLV